MGTRKTLVRSEAGVTLERIERLSARGAAHLSGFELSSRRFVETQRIAEEREAHDAFDLEVIAVLSDPELQRDEHRREEPRG